MFRVSSFYTDTFSKYFLHACMCGVIRTHKAHNALTDSLLLNVECQVTVPLAGSYVFFDIC